jgi:hypothetical protein
MYRQYRQYSSRTRQYNQVQYSSMRQYNQKLCRLYNRRQYR